MALSRDEVVNGALTLLDKVGLDALTMRRLAQALGVQAGAIYWHFKNKQELVDAMADTMMAGIATPPPTGSWDQQLGELARRMAAALMKWRDAARLASQALKPGRNSLENGEAMLRIIGSSGRSPEASLWTASVVGYYILGFVTDMQAQADAVQKRGITQLLRDFQRELDSERYPEIAKFTPKQLANMFKGEQARARFEFGLAVILRGLTTSDGAAKAATAKAATAKATRAKATRAKSAKARRPQRRG